MVNSLIVNFSRSPTKQLDDRSLPGQGRIHFDGSLRISMPDSMAEQQNHAKQLCGTSGDRESAESVRELRAIFCCWQYTLDNVVRIFMGYVCGD